MDSTTVSTSLYPAHWLQAGTAPFDARPGIVTGEAASDLLQVEQRLSWFAAEQHQLIAAGLAQTTYLIRPHLIAHDQERHIATFECFGRDCLGNEVTHYASATGEDCLEGASIKAISFTLAAFGYGAHNRPGGAVAQADSHPGIEAVRSPSASMAPASPGEQDGFTPGTAVVGGASERQADSPADPQRRQERAPGPAALSAPRPLNTAPGSVTPKQWEEFDAHHRRVNGTSPDSKLQNTLSEAAAARWIETLKGKPDRALRS